MVRDHGAVSPDGQAPLTSRARVADHTATTATRTCRARSRASSRAAATRCRTPCVPAACSLWRLGTPSSSKDTRCACAYVGCAREERSRYRRVPGDLCLATADGAKDWAAPIETPCPSDRTCSCAACW